MFTFSLVIFCPALPTLRTINIYRLHTDLIHCYILSIFLLWGNVFNARSLRLSFNLIINSSTVNSPVSMYNQFIPIIFPSCHFSFPLSNLPCNTSLSMIWCILFTLTVVLLNVSYTYKPQWTSDYKGSKSNILKSLQLVIKYGEPVTIYSSVVCIRDFPNPTAFA